MRINVECCDRLGPCTSSDMSSCSGAWQLAGNNHLRRDSILSQPSSRRWSCTWARKSAGANGCSMPRSRPWSPCAASGSLVARQHPGRRPGPGSRNRNASRPPSDTPARWERSRHRRVAKSRAEPEDVADACGDSNGNGLELIRVTCPGFVGSSRSSNSHKNPALKGSADTVPARHAVSPHLCPRCIPGPGGVLSLSWSPVTESNRRPSPYHGVPIGFPARDYLKGQIRGSISARLGQVQGGSRRMRPPRFLPTGRGGGVHVLPRFRPARSRPIGTADQQDELAEAVRSGFSAAATHWAMMTCPRP